MKEASEDDLAANRMAAVERQIHAKCRSGYKRILCPYCGHWNKRGSEFCCDLLRKAVVAVLLGDRALETAEAGERAMQN
jgi:hypothetical protein